MNARPRADIIARLRQAAAAKPGLHFFWTGFEIPNESYASDGTQRNANNVVATCCRSDAQFRNIEGRLSKSDLWFDSHKVGFAPRPLKGLSENCGAVNEWPVFALRGGVKIYAAAAFSALRAHAAQKMNSQIGL